jgi:hypothetical protein
MPKVQRDETALPPGSNLKRRGKLRLITRQAIDGRSRARKQFDSIARGIAADLGGEDRLSTVQKHLIEAFAGAALQMHDFNARLLLGQNINLSDQLAAISAMVRVAARLPLTRVPKEVQPLDSYLRERRTNGADFVEAEVD